MKRKITLWEKKNSKIIVVAYPDDWNNERLKNEIHKAVDDLSSINIKGKSDDFPDLEFDDDGVCLSFAHLN